MISSVKTKKIFNLNWSVLTALTGNALIKGALAYKFLSDFGISLSSGKINISAIAVF